MKAVRFYMKSGNVIEFECSGIEITHNGLGILTEYEAAHGNSKNRIICADISRIEGVTVKDLDE